MRKSQSTSYNKSTHIFKCTSGEFVLTPPRYSLLLLTYYLLFLDIDISQEHVARESAVHTSAY